MAGGAHQDARSRAVRLLRRLRFGKPVIVVSGLPRSGTSMAMAMLQAGGVPLLVDNVRTADAGNPRGYYEFEPVKELHRQPDAAWLREARGKAVKIVSFLLTWLPETCNYAVIFMQRDLEEVIASENAMLQASGTPQQAADGQHTLRLYEGHLAQVSRFLERRGCFSVLPVNYADVLQRPVEEARRITEFLGMRLDLRAMARVVDPALYRNRR